VPGSAYICHTCVHIQVCVYFCAAATAAGVAHSAGFSLYMPYMCTYSSVRVLLCRSHSGGSSSQCRVQPIYAIHVYISMVDVFTKQALIVIKCGEGSSSCGRLWWCSCRVMWCVVLIVCLWCVTCFSSYKTG